MSDRIALQGERGCFSHLASLEIFPNAEIKFCSTFEETFQLAKQNPKYKIVIPIENSARIGYLNASKYGAKRSSAAPDGEENVAFF